jgi:hypothetical protein
MVYILYKHRLYCGYEIARHQTNQDTKQISDEGSAKLPNLF